MKPITKKAYLGIDRQTDNFAEKTITMFLFIFTYKLDRK